MSQKEILIYFQELLNTIVQKSYLNSEIDTIVAIRFFSEIFLKDTDGKSYKTYVIDLYEEVLDYLGGAAATLYSETEKVTEKEKKAYDFYMSKRIDVMVELSYLYKCFFTQLDSEIDESKEEMKNFKIIQSDI